MIRLFTTPTHGFVDITERSSRIPADLMDHNCLGFTGLHPYTQWELTCDDDQKTIRVCSGMVSNDNEALMSTARMGLGILAGGE